MTGDVQVVGKVIKPVLEWRGLGTANGLRRNATGFGKIKEMLLDDGLPHPLRINVFLFAFLFPAKNFDFLISVDCSDVEMDVPAIRDGMRLLASVEAGRETFSRHFPAETYREARSVLKRDSARDERRVLTTLLFSGPSTAPEVEEELKLRPGLVERMFVALRPVVEVDPDDRDEAGNNRACIRPGIHNMAIVLFLLQCTVGIDPLRVVERFIAENAGGV